MAHKTRIVANLDFVPHNITVAISGGVDSVAVAHFLSQSKRKINLFHFNHKLRPQNDEMEEKVRDFANKFNLQLFIRSALDFPLEQWKTTSKEAQARESRLAALNDCGLSNIVVAHHLQDAIESYLMKCMTGIKNIKNYYCIPPISQFKNFTLYRPFLLTLKKNFQEYINQKKLNEFIIEDETNIDIKFRRNMIRQELIPLINQHWNGLEEVVRTHVKEDYKKIITLSHQ